jgi:hypothetical protein
VTDYLFLTVMAWIAKVKKFKSDIILGEKYIDEQTGYTGVATGITFYQHACERVCVESYDAERKQIKEMIFDAPRLRLVGGKQVKVRGKNKTGGPGDSNDYRPSTNARAV